MTFFMANRSLIPTALKLSLIPASITLVVSWLCIVGYNIHVEVLYRPIENGPATHPLTALIFIVLATGCFTLTLKMNKTTVILSSVAFIIGCVRLLDHLGSPDLFNVLKNAANAFADQNLDDDNVTMGLNTAIVANILSTALLSLVWKRYTFAHLLAYLSLSIGLFAIIGYLYKVEAFYGKMSPVTILLTLSVTCSVALVNANRGIVRTFLSNHFSGRLARYQLLATLIFLTGLRWFFDDKIQAPIDSLYLKEFFFILLFISSLIFVSAILHEKLDRRQRHATQALKYAAMHDPLTSLLNRHACEMWVKKQLFLQKRTGGMLGLLLIDIDHFKAVNDTFGHLEGDKTLVKIASAIKNTLRRSDIAARHGGEEFIVMLPYTDIHGAVAVALKIKQAIAALELPMDLKAKEKVTVSIGCTAIDPSEQSYESAISMADDALYAAKNAGRNLVATGTRLANSGVSYHVVNNHTSQETPNSTVQAS